MLGTLECDTSSVTLECHFRTRTRVFTKRGTLDTRTRVLTKILALVSATRVSRVRVSIQIFNFFQINPNEISKTIKRWRSLF